MHDLEILRKITYDDWMLVIAWLMVIFVVWYVAIKVCNQQHRDWSESGGLRGRDDDMVDF